jgi:hypothetical protein
MTTKARASFRIESSSEKDPTALRRTLEQRLKNRLCDTGRLEARQYNAAALASSNSYQEQSTSGVRAQGVPAASKPLQTDPEWFF